MRGRHQPIETTDGLRWFVYNTGESSRKFGPCEVCREHVAEVHSMGREKGDECLFGHRACLEKCAKAGAERVREVSDGFFREHHGPQAVAS